MLEEYQKKRDFSRTAEPPPKQQTGIGGLIFVVQKHAARRLHYDFRLELDGVLKSWAVPNGPSLDPKTKRLAVMVEDHPLEYSDFEGVIPKGEYGAGEVIVWDKGMYSPDQEGTLFFEDRTRAQEIVREGLGKGKISIVLQGNKLKGSWALVKMQRGKDNWLLIKHQDKFARIGPDITEESSSISGLTIEALKEQPPAKLKPIDISKIRGAHPSTFPSSAAPMLGTLVKVPFSDPGWIFEPKLDGYRVMALVRGGETRLLSRRGLDVAHQYPELVEDLDRQTDGEAVLDGEVVALDRKGRPDFQLLQNHLNQKDVTDSRGKKIKIPIVYYIFDILYLNGYELRDVPLYRRKELLKGAIVPSGHVRLVQYFETDGVMLYETAVNFGLEGIMAKLKDSPYDEGRRSKNWLKIKATSSDDFIIGGFTQGSGNRENTFGSLILGSYDKDGRLVFVGHVGTGFDDKLLVELRKKLDKIKAKESPFSEKVPLNAPANWVKPELVAEVKFAERTREGYLRAPVFLRLRDDKSSSEVKFVDNIQGAPGVSTSKKNTSHPRSESAEAIADQLADQERESLEIDLDGYKLAFTNLEKILWPSHDGQPAFFKRDLLVYLARAWPYVLPHLAGRPITLSRYPDGITGEQFYQKHLENLPDFVKVVSLTEHEGGSREYLVCDNLATLLWLGQLANLELHTWFSRIEPEESEPVHFASATPDFIASYPDFIIFDIDPYIYSGKEGKGAEPELNQRAFDQTCQVARWLQDILDGLSLHSFIKTSGMTGLHIYVPIIRQLEFPAVHAAAKTICGYVLNRHPREVTLDCSVAKRTGKIFLDYNQNVRGKTLASPYSPRPSPQATVSAPLKWEEVGKVYPTDFKISNMPARLAKTGDIWADILQKRSDLSNILHI